MFDYNVLYDSTNPITAMILFMVYEVGLDWNYAHCRASAGLYYEQFMCNFQPGQAFKKRLNTDALCST